MRKVSIINLVTIICLFILLVADYNLVEARGRGGGGGRGGGYTKSGPSRGGSMNSNRSYRGSRQSYGGRGGGSRHYQQNNYYYHGGRRYNRYYGNSWATAFAAGTILVVGTIVVVSAFQSTSCPTNVVIVGSTSYYYCGSGWYNKGYREGELVYIATTAPSGY